MVSISKAQCQEMVMAMWRIVLVSYSVKVLVAAAMRRYTQDKLVMKVVWRKIVAKNTSICLALHVMKAMRRSATVR